MRAVTNPVRYEQLRHTFLSLMLSIICATLQSCASNKPNLLCAQGCKGRSESAAEQWSLELRDYLYPHGSEKHIVVHPATDAWELDQRCGKPGLLRALFNVAALEAVRGAQIAAKLVTARVVTDNSMPKICKAALQKAADHNTHPEVIAEIEKWKRANP